MVRCQRDIVKSMKAETPVIRSSTHNLLLQWMEYQLLQLPLVEPKHDFAKLYQSIFNDLIRKKYIWLERSMCFESSFSRIPVHIVSCESRYTGLPYRYVSLWQNIVHRDVPMNHYTPTTRLPPALTGKICMTCGTLTSQVQNQSW